MRWQNIRMIEHFNVFIPFNDYIIPQEDGAQNARYSNSRKDIFSFFCS